MKRDLLHFIPISQIILQQMKYCWFVIGILFSTTLSGNQASNVVQITLKIMEGDTPLTNHEVRIFQTVRYTDPEQGIIVFELPDNQTSFKVDIPGKVITLPEDGIVYLLKEPVTFFTILIGSKSEQKTFTEINRKLEGLAENVGNLEEYIKKSQAVVEAYLEQNNVELEQFKIKQLLEIQKEKQFIREGQLKTIPALTNLLDQYISRTKDLCDVLDQSEDKVFNDNGANINKINLSISAYNQAYEELNKHRETIISYLENYWGQGILYEQTRHLLNEALQNIHQLELLISNKLINDINNYNERRRGRREKAEIQSDIADSVGRIRIMVENLDKDKTRIIQKMKEYYPLTT